MPRPSPTAKPTSTSARPAERKASSASHALTGRRSIPLNPANGREGPRQLAVIDEAWCIGCTLCIKACPVDCIVGAPKHMHTVIDELCTGCELCIPVCPVDCISLVNVTAERTGWDAWSAAQAAQARSRYAFHQQRLAHDKHENDARLEALAQAKLDRPSSEASPHRRSGRARTQARDDRGGACQSQGPARRA